ncbi:MAG: hypothetical protein GWN18_10545 [Thermoplasmata archaeon]|nr:hypothetical protein [Thermoplasmata archaeon]NIS12484.1 hypothetical protein [Thermoplasmata archaeon]NIS20403.1 hypothetical protein [Thermoplasmata archaeon]NIT77749.1 hypothetical protein [Thermoplasmata archaeon]NIU49490.1 hypothetical protein [Thermoplasmata archaeon]
MSEPYSMDTLALSDNDLIEVSWVDVTYQGQDYVGTPLSWLVAQAAPDPTIDSIMVSAGDGYFAVFPLPDITDTVLAFMLDDTSPIPLEDGPFRIVDNGRSGPFQVSWVVDIEVFSSTPIEASGDVNVTDVLDLGYIASNADVEITYFDGRKDRTYGGLSWDSTLAALDYATWTTQVKLVDADEGSTTWTIGDLLGRTDSGICVDSRGNYVAYNGALEEAFPNIVSIEVS